MATSRLVLRIGLISAVPLEGKIILRHLKKINKKVPFGLALYKGKIYDKSIVYITSGIGKTNASHGATILIERFSPNIIINFGVGGAYPSSGLKIGDIVIAEKEIYGDEGVLSGDGFHGAEFMGIPFFKKGKKKYFNEFQLDRKLLKEALKSFNLVTKIKSGPFLTLSTCTGTSERAKELEKIYHAICENMEGASVAHVCTLHGIPMVEIRGISNTVEDRDTKKWGLKLAAENCQRVVMELIKIL
ncbi:MAG: futalosine hydrolase [Thermodesulfovibrionales bacterium]|nr:futalosine hydrolase [Thermodesulfovibrionales bacterium]